MGQTLHQIEGASGGQVTRFGRNERDYLLFPAWAMLAGLPFFVFGLLASAWPTALACLAIPMTTNSMYLAPATALVQNNVPPNQRSAAAAILLLVLNLFGTGLGPLFVGAMSEALTPQFGAQALVYAMLCLTPLFPIAAGTLWLVSQVMGRASPVEADATVNRQ